MKLLLKLAWRNIWRNKRRSILTLAAVTFATLLAIGMRGVQLGTYALNIRTVVELFSGYIQIQQKDYQDNPSLNKSFRYNETLKKEIENSKNVLAYTPRVYADGLISFKDVSLGGAIIGLDPANEKKVTKFTQNIESGKFFTSDSSNEIVVGKKLLHNLDANVGDTIVVLAQGYDGSLGNQKFIISGSINMGGQEMDAAMIFMGLKTAQNLLGLSNRVNAVAVKITSLDEVNESVESIKKNLSSTNLSVLGWKKVNPELEQSIQLDNVSGILFLGILIVIVAFGILNTVLMSVTERFREFGVVLAIGMPQKKLVDLVYLETIIITVLGLILGNILGYFVNYYFVLNPISFGEEMKKIYEVYHFLPRMESSLNPSIFIYVSLSIFVVSIISCIYPAIKVFKLEPLKGIRHT